MKRSVAKMALLTIIPQVAFLAGGLSAAEETRVFDVPRLDGIVIDGKADDWHGAGFKVKIMTSVDGWVRSAPDMDCCFSLGWD